MFHAGKIDTDRFSASVTPARQSSNYGVVISLVSKHSDDKRVLSLVPGQRLVVGRASRSDLKNLQPAFNNALFDCPVISRTHAEIKLSAWHLPQKRFTITDHSSLHGTMVNGIKLKPGQEVGLQPGDMIKLGEKVIRGEDTHDGLSLTFTLLEDAADSPSAQKSIQFKVPDPPEDELSDIDDKGICDKSSSGYLSSALTTPEKVENKSCSQESSMNSDRTSAEITSLGSLYSKRGSCALSGRLPSSGQVSPGHIIPDTYQDDESISMKPGLSSSSGTSVFVPEDRTSTDHQPRHMQSVPYRDETVTYASYFGSHDSRQEAEEARVEDTDMASANGDTKYHSFAQDAADDLSGSGISNQPNASAPCEPNHAHEEWPGHRPTSPDLGDLGTLETATRLTGNSNHGFSNFPALAFSSLYTPSIRTPAPFTPKPRYDPVRNSQPSAEEISASSVQSQPPKTASSYTYDSRAHGSTIVSPAADLHGSGHWDVQHSVPLLSSADQQSNSDINIDVWKAPEQHTGAIPVASPTHNMSNSIPWRFDLLRPHTEACPIKGDIPINKGKISIPDIVGEPSQAIEDGRDAGTRDNEIVPDTPSSATKRKADEMEPAPHNVMVCRNAKKTKPTAEERALILRSRPRHRVGGVSIARGVARSAIHLATGAVFGAAGLAWFLASDYSQQLVEWLA